MRKLFIIAVSVGLLYSCGMKEENETLKLQNDDLKRELEIAQKSATTLQEVGVLLDSIDASRNTIRMSLESGTSYEDYVARLNGLNEFIKESEAKIAELENSIDKNKNIYYGQINKLKKDLKKRTEEVTALTEQVEKYKTENEDLITKVMLQESELQDKEAQLVAKREELNLIENKIQELMIQSKMSEADATFARAQAVEEAANRTKLAPKKKKETFAEALNLYRQAKELGHEGCEEKITKLEKILS